MTEPLRILFYKRDIAWPFRSGHDVHTFNMMNGLAAAGHHIGLVTALPLAAAVRQSLQCEFYATLDPDSGAEAAPAGLPPMQERFRRFWGVSTAHLDSIRQLTQRFHADALVVSGLEVLPVLGAVPGVVRIWYAADEWVLHHLSQVHVFDARSWRNVYDGLVKGLYERAFRSAIDRVWAVTAIDAWAFRRIAGFPAADIVPNGVDANRYQPSADPQEPFTAVFWGRLDFGPNIQALEWFCSRVWPLVLQRQTAARFTIIGFQPGDEVLRLSALPGVALCADLPDVRQMVHSRAVVVLPFTSGTGIKNKLLEAAAMGKAIVCTPTALTGLNSPPFIGLQDPRAWVDELTALWSDDAERRRRGVAAREWVTRHHTWAAAAQRAADGIVEALAARKLPQRQ
jgi:glycosyltransferase involved in cell wall biosynthesis